MSQTAVAVLQTQHTAKFSNSLFLDKEILCSGTPRKSGTTSACYVLCLQHIHPAAEALEGHPEAALGDPDRTCSTWLLDLILSKRNVLS